MGKGIGRGWREEGEREKARQGGWEVGGGGVKHVIIDFNVNKILRADGPSFLPALVLIPN